MTKDKQPRFEEVHAFRFNCYPGVSCFTNCCQDITIVLTPYDVLRLKNSLGIPSGEFLDKPPAALAYIKRVLRSSHGKTLQEGIDEEGDLFASLITEDEQALEMMREYLASGHQLKRISGSSR